MPRASFDGVPGRLGRGTSGRGLGRGVTGLCTAPAWRVAEATLPTPSPSSSSSAGAGREDGQANGLPVQTSPPAVALPTRMAWADMDSGDSESDNGDEHAGLRILTRPAREASSVAGCSAKVSEAKCAHDAPNVPGPQHDLDADRWVDEARAMAAQLRALAARAPQRPGPPCSDIAIGTDATAADVDRLNVGRRRLANLHQLAAALRAEVDAATIATADLQRRASVVSSSAQSVAETTRVVTAAQFLAHNSVLASVARASEVAAGAAEDAKVAVRETREAAEARSLELQHLQMAANRKAKALSTANSEAAAAVASRSCLRDGPRLKQRQVAAEALIAKTEDARKQLQLLVSGLQSELEAAPRGRGARAEMLEPRIADLERECRELTDSCSARPAAASNEPPDLESGCGPPPPLPPAPLAPGELAAAQERSRRLVAAVKDARAARDKAAAELEVVKASTASARRRAEADGVPFYGLEEQLRERTVSLADARREKEAHECEVAALERKQQLVDEMAAGLRGKHRSVELQMRESLQRKRKDEDAAMFTEWQLQTAVAELVKLKSNNAISKCLQSSRPARATGLPPLQRRAGCEAGEGTDGDASTTAGDSVAEGVQSPLGSLSLV